MYGLPQRLVNAALVAAIHGLAVVIYPYGSTLAEPWITGTSPVMTLLGVSLKSVGIIQWPKLLSSAAAIAGCARAVGNLFAALVSVPKEALTCTRGKPGRIRSSEHVERGFCTQCGTPLFFDSLNSDEIGLCIGAFDAPQSLVPLSHKSTESRMPWFSEIIAIRDAGTSEEIDGPGRVQAVKASNRQHPDHDTAMWPPTM